MYIQRLGLGHFCPTKQMDFLLLRVFINLKSRTAKLKNSSVYIYIKKKVKSKLYLKKRRVFPAFQSAGSYIQSEYSELQSYTQLHQFIHSYVSLNCLWKPHQVTVVWPETVAQVRTPADTG